MAYDIKFKKDGDVNGVEYKKGDTLRVSSSIYNRLKDEGIADIEKPKKAEK